LVTVLLLAPQGADGDVSQVIRPALGERTVHVIDCDVAVASAASRA
jgi:hypothetical protein